MIYVVLGLALAIGVNLIVYAFTTPGIQPLASMLGGTLSSFAITYLIMDYFFG